MNQDPREPFYVGVGEIDRTKTLTNVNTLKGSRKLHQCINIPFSPNKLLTKKLSCYCTSCRNEDTDLCFYKEYTGEFDEIDTNAKKMCSS
jgi:hypothetical protein